MMKIKKEKILLITTAALLAAVLAIILIMDKGNKQTPDIIDGGFTISGESVTANAGEHVEMKLNISENPGIAYIRVTLETDAGITQGEAVNGEVLDTLDQGKNLVWSADQNSTQNGILATVGFDIPADTPAGEHPVKIILRECYNEKFENLGGIIENGKIYVSVGGDQNE